MAVLEQTSTSLQGAEYQEGVRSTKHEIPIQQSARHLLDIEGKLSGDIFERQSILNYTVFCRLFKLSWCCDLLPALFIK